MLRSLLHRLAGRHRYVGRHRGSGRARPESAVLSVVLDNPDA